MRRIVSLVAVALLANAIAALGSAPGVHPVIVPFDFSSHAIGLNVTVNGKPLYMLLDYAGKRLSLFGDCAR